MKCIRRHFSLLEVMIAFFLIAIAMIPLISPYGYMLKAEKEELRELEADRIAPILYVDFLSRWLRKEIDQNNLDKEIHKVESPLLVPFKIEATYLYEERSSGFFIVYTFNINNKKINFDYAIPKSKNENSP